MHDHVILSNEDGSFGDWVDLVGNNSRVLSFAIDRLKSSDFARCGLSGKYKLMILNVEAGIVAVMVFLAEEPSGGASILMSDDYRETLSDAIRFEFDPKENPWDSELFNVLLGNESIFEYVFFQLAGYSPPGEF